MSIENRMFYFPQLTEHGQTVIITGEEQHHLEKVMRCTVGDEIRATDGRGMFFSCIVRFMNKRECGIEAVSSVQKTPYPISIHMYGAVTKRDKYEWLIEKGTESGILHFTPVICERNKEYARGEKIERYEKIAIAAMKQSRRPFLPIIYPPVDVQTLVKQQIVGNIYILAFGAPYFSQSDAACPAVALVIGPEGGFTEKEEKLLLTKQAQPRAFGEYTLKTETAALKAAMLINHYGGEF